MRLFIWSLLSHSIMFLMNRLLNHLRSFVFVEA